MLQPVNLQLAHFNVERAAQATKDVHAVPQQIGQEKEIAEESVRRTQTVQAGVAADEAGKVKRRTEDEEREHRRRQQSFSGRGSADDEPAEAASEEIQVKKAPKGFELYA